MASRECNIHSMHSSMKVPVTVRMQVYTSSHSTKITFKCQGSLTTLCPSHV